MKFDVLLGHYTKLTHTKLCAKIGHILRVMGKKMSVPDLTNLGLQCMLFFVGYLVSHKLRAFS